MKRQFADLHLRLNVEDQAKTERLMTKTAELGYRLVAAPLPPETRTEKVAALRKACGETGLDFASRVDLRPRNQNELLSQLRRFRRRFEVVAVLCENKEVARQAAKDRRVDLLNFPLLDFRSRFFDRAEAELASSCMAVLEVDVKPLLALEGPARTRLLASLRRETSVALSFHLPIVVSSGASETALLRKPREAAALCGLFGLGEPAGLDAVSANPAAIVARNREKLGKGFVAPGVRVVKEGADC
ncbi:MAG: RNase P subunit p30 family protein [Candidatus Bathyarchaeia archaeon]